MYFWQHDFWYFLGVCIGGVVFGSTKREKN